MEYYYITTLLLQLNFTVLQNVRAKSIFKRNIASSTNLVQFMCVTRIPVVGGIVTRARIMQPHASIVRVSDTGGARCAHLTAPVERT